MAENISTSQPKAKKRSDYLEWDEYFMALAFLSAQRSKDPSTQVLYCASTQYYIILTTHTIVGLYSIAYDLRSGGGLYSQQEQEDSWYWLQWNA